MPNKIASSIVFKSRYVPCIRPIPNETTSVSKAHHQLLNGFFLLLLLSFFCNAASNEPQASSENASGIQAGLDEWPEDGVALTVNSVQQLERDPPFAMNVERHVRILCPPSLVGAGDFIEKSLRRRHPNNDDLDVTIVRETARRLRAKIKGVKREVLTDGDNWELVFIDVSVTESFSSLSDFVRMQEEIQGIPSHWEEIREELNRKSDYDLSAVVHGRFRAGGEPSAEHGYEHDFELKNLTSELTDYASRVLEEIQDFFRTKIKSTYNASTGRPVQTGNRLDSNQCS